MQVLINANRIVDYDDYDDSDVKIETGDNKGSSAIETTEDAQLDIYPTDATQPDQPAQKTSPKERDKEVLETHDNNVSMSTSTVTKTPQAAALIKALQDMLAHCAFRTSLDLIDWQYCRSQHLGKRTRLCVTLKFTGAAEAKACKYGAKCHNTKCTFDYGGADRTTTITARKPRKLCSMINTPTSCPKETDCWYAHAASGVVCAHGDIWATCPKGSYCSYKHNDDEAVAPAERVEQPPMQVKNTVQIKEMEATAQTTTSVEESSNPAPSATGAAIRPKQLAAPKQEAVPEQQKSECKRGHKSEEDIEDRLRKTQRVQKYQDRQDGSYGEHVQSDSQRTVVEAVIVDAQILDVVESRKR